MSENETSPQSFSDWVNKLKLGDAGAQTELFKRYFKCMSNFSERKLTRVTRRVVEGEDVALSAINSFINGVQAERFPKLESDSDLWRLLVVISARKAVRYNERQHALKRGSGQVRGESVFMVPANESRNLTLAEAAEDQSEFESKFEACAEELLNKLEDDSLRTIVLLKMQGFDNEEVAEQIGCVARTVRRKLDVIRQCWEESQ